MSRNRSTFVVALALAAVLVAARRAPNHVGAQAADGCWFQPKSQDPTIRASKHDSTSVALDGGTVKICYGRPNVRGRPIMGGLVPYDQPWRLGADEATAIYVPFRAKIAGVKVEPGWYSLYVIPTAKEWQIVVNSDAKRWGVDIDAKVRAKDVGTGTVPSAKNAAPVEALTIALSKDSPSKATIDVQWADTEVRIPVEKQ
ncbi:MAG: DUF2911 domain-containing protein [Gemmatimonadaceae bacterium]